MTGQDDKEMLEWVETHINDDPIKLRLKYSGKLPWLDMALLQIECRRKARKKLPDTLKCKDFIFPTLLSEEQCTSDMLAEFHASLIDEGTTVADLTGGLGIDTFHIAARASAVTVTEQNPVVAEALRHNAKALGKGNVEVINDDCGNFLDSTDRHYDIMFIDPARRGAAGERVYRLSDCSPDVTAQLPLIAKKSGRLILKASPMLDITQVLRELPATTDLYVVGTATECKEMVADISFDAEKKTPEIHLWTPEKRFTFTQEEESEATANYDLPAAGGYLYEPGATLMKAAPYKLLSQRFGVSKLHHNTHLYYSPSLIDGFPGEAWHIDRVAEFSSGELKRLAKEYPRINVAVRNFDYTADWLRKKLKVKDGDDRRLIGTTLCDGSKAMLILSRP